MVIPTDPEEVTKDHAIINVLDHGFVRLVDFMGNDLSIVRAARVSYDADWRAGEDEGKDEKLINYLWKNKHTSPFEACTITFEVKAPIFIFRQWHRHRTWSYNEVSARYTELPNECYVPEIDVVGSQSANNKQVRDMNNINIVGADKGIEKLIRHNTEAHLLYAELIYDLKWPRELARMVLPLNTYSRMFATVNLLNLLKFLSLRDHSHAQFEIREYAKAMKELITPVFPVTMKVFDNARQDQG